MKALFFLFTLALISTTFNCQAQWNKVKGEGPIVTKKLNIDDFQNLGLGISADVILTQGPKQEVTIKGQQNIIDNIKIKVKGNSWSINFHDDASDYKDLTIYITLPTLESISIGGSGNISSTNNFNNSDDMDISIGGSGDVSLDLNAKDVDIRIGGSGKVALKGEGEDLDISIGGSGDVMAFDFTVNTCDVSSAGSGDIDLNVSDKLNVSLVGSGDVTYKGNPKVKSSIVGSGDVERKN
ncbi:MAG: hypothetical protein ACI9XB_001581 [Gammaproteobacteria bacterium]|jgi:hypothetical protein